MNMWRNASHPPPLLPGDIESDRVLIAQRQADREPYVMIARWVDYGDDCEDGGFWKRDGADGVTVANIVAWMPLPALTD
jgi:hypothetical protein